VRWLTPTKAVLQLSVRYKWEDIFWFSFFHEAGHILLHGKREAFVETREPATSDEEREADEFAMRWLIPDEDADRLNGLQTDEEIRRFAVELRLPPAVVVGRLQHEGLLPYTRGHHLRRRFQLVASNNA
jgi:Zn-dependent peptidase ImmA (M78 family)